MFVLQHFIGCYTMVYGYHISYLKYTNNIPAQFFRNLLFYMKPYTISIIMSGITDPFTLRYKNKTYQNIKKNVLLFFNIEGQMHLDSKVNFPTGHTNMTITCLPDGQYSLSIAVPNRLVDSSTHNSQGCLPLMLSRQKILCLRSLVRILWLAYCINRN